ncbi:cytoplasmic dynein 2 intermediate chain 1 isoform X2 [Microplitis mediator]|uniref:cytoplasmic dynein 2 intermediate chain 1 isoform X2 n=1 Tax=Microplitis mediator TaxID=375433 RepID=UPI002554C59C|nr:cytoplasmic dynein 2 intermediate chain 1 isoform X2 [Microplitis mediator]
MSSKANVSRKSNLSQETSTRSRDDRKRTSTSKKEDEKKSNAGTSSKKKIESTVIKDPIKSSGNSGRAERSIKNLNPTSSKNLNLHKSSSSKTQGTIANGVKSKLIKQSSDEKRGLSTIYMPGKKSHSTSKQNTSKREPSPEYEYEDDFEDYESDFQECTDSEASQVSDESESASLDEEEPVELQPAQKSDKLVANVVLPRKYVEEEHMLDSGHYELQEARRRAARIDLMSGNRSINLVNNTQVIQRPIIYSDEKPSEIKSLPSSADEGFEDGRSGDFAKSPLIPGSFESGNQSDKKKSISRRLARGKQILQMIKLDVVEWSLFECTPIAYEEFIRIYGKINTRQISTQTNEDSLSVDVQTDDIECRNMWTQFPVVCRSHLKTSEDIKLFTRELIGVGGDDDELTERPHHDILQLNEFLSNAGKLMLALLEGKSSYVSSLDSNEIPMPFSDATIKLSVANVTFLSNRPVTMIRYSDISSRILITIHEPADEDIETAADEYVTDCCIGCQWNIGEPSRPTKIFYSSSNISACCFHPTNNNIIFAGLEDGSMSLWDLGEDEYYHRKIFDSDNKLGWIVRSPTFNTGGNFDDRTSSSSKIVALSVLSKVESDSTDVRKFMPIQICSLDEDGSCVVWSVLKNFQGAASNDLGQSWWGKLRLVKSHEIPLHLEKHFKLNNIRGFRDIKIDSVDVNSLYVASNVNKVLHATRIGKKPQPFAYNGNDCTGGMTCIENCPFNLPFFLAGCEDGTVCLYSSTIERPLLKFKNLNTTAAIKIIQWSRSKPLTIFILDNDSCIHVWDLSKSDIFPTHSISPGKYSHVDSMELSPCKSNNDFINQYMALGLNNGNVEIHKFNDEFQYSDKNEISTELKVLINYLSIC